MRQLIVTEFMSLDGVVEAPGGEPGYAHTNWVGERFSEQLGTWKFEEQDAADILLLGRVTYESFFGAWPQREGPLADKINTMTKYVVSSTLGSSEWANTSVISGDVEAAISELKQGDGGPILVVGSRTLAQSLFAAGLIDQLNLTVFPVALRSGARLFPESPEKLDLELLSSETFPNGVVSLQYRVLHPEG